jgi:PAS domain S-box-containing protein
VKDKQGQVTGILCIGRDVTELQKAREALVFSEKRSRAIVETAVNAIITMSEERIIETVNTATERIFGYSKEEMVGRNIRMLMPQPYRDNHDGYVKSYLDTGVKKIIGIGREAVGQRKDGSIFPLDLSVGEVRLQDGRRVFTGIIRDLTDRKLLEEKILQISEEEQHRIGQDIHDDLCQQLAAIGCLAKVAHQQLTKGGSEQAENLHEIVRLVTHANVRAREMSRGLMPVVLDSEGLMAALAELAQGTERIFRVSCPFRCDRPVQVPDNKVATQLFRIAQEAVANAIKHSHADRIELSLTEEEDGMQLLIRDNGVGIPDNVSGKSTGMGLLTMSHRTRMIGGVFAVEHDESGGTLVRCRVPLPTPQKTPQRRNRS